MSNDTLVVQMSTPNPDEPYDTAAHRVASRCVQYIDTHPRVGWYIATISTGNFLLTIFELLGG